MTSSLSRELVFLILQFLDEEKYRDTVHRLEQESGFFFNMKYFEDEVLSGNWDDAERYLSGFTKVDDNRYSMKIFFELRKQNYLEALDKHDTTKAVDILIKNLKVFASFNEELFKELTNLLTLENFRENEQLSKYGDTKTARAILLIELKKLIEANPSLREKLQLPSLKASRLRTLVNQSLNWQHQLCKNPKPNPDIKTLFVDHYCGQPTGTSAQSQANNSVLGPLQRTGGFPALAAHTVMPFQPASVPIPTSLAGWMSNPQAVTQQAVPAGAIAFRAPTIPGPILMQPRTASLPSTDYDLEYKTIRPVGTSEGVTHPVNILPVTNPSNHNHAMYSADDLPRAVARTLIQGSTPMSMDFHPTQHTLLLVGTNVGDIGLWNTGSRERLVLKHFAVWEIQGAPVKDKIVSVNRIIWSPDGSLFGVAFSLHIVQIYLYHGGDDIRQHLEIDAHVGGVNDLAFAHPNKEMYVITCGDDKTIKVWDANTGTRRFTFEGHGAPVYSVCPHSKENIQFVFSTALDGKIKAWLYDNLGSRVDYDAPGHWCTTLAYSADGTRLFSCGTSKDGDSYIVEWNESEGVIKKSYLGLHKRSLGVLQFDTTRNRFLAAGDEFLIKYWDMDDTQLLNTVNADGGLPASPRIRFNKEGSLLAVSTHDNGIKVLANADGLRLLQIFENRSSESSRIVAENVATKPGVTASTALAGGTSSVMTGSVVPATAKPEMEDESMDVKPRVVDELVDKTKICKLTEINESSHCRSLRLFDNTRTSKISRMIYTNAGVAILALASNAVHILWKWSRSADNPAAMARTDITPQLWQPPGSTMMTNVCTDTNPEEALPCIALSKNDSYILSGSGGKLSLFNMMNFKTMTTYLNPPPAATFLAFHPRDNNIVAIGMDDSTIHIFDVRTDQVKYKLKFHLKRVTGLTFSNALKVLVSSGADAQICVWDVDGWEKLRSAFLKIPSSHTPNLPDTCVEFHRDEKQFIAVNKALIAIYEVAKLECLRQWVPPEGTASISHAVYSCDSQSIYACFVDATVCVFSGTNLSLLCRINPAAYLPANTCLTVYPLVIAAHPHEANQFALGLTDGSIHVLEPLKSEGRWGVTPPTENGSTSKSSAMPPSGASSDQMVE